jgi:tRNA(Ile2) C34 agmatinyltransferase TiaS
MMTEDKRAAAKANNPDCPGCGEQLSGEDLEDLRCSSCGGELPPRLGI